MLITNGTIVTPGVRRRTIQRQVHFGPVTLRFATVIILAAAALITLAQSTQSATKTYRVEELKRELATTQEEVERMEFEATRLQSFREVTAQATPTPTPTPVLSQPDKINHLPGSSNAHLTQATTVTAVR